MATRPPSPIDRAFLTDHPESGSLVLVRHGQQQWPDPANSVTADWVDPPLSELGRQQAKAVGVHLAGETVHAVYSSHLQRAHDTGRAIAEHHRLDVTVRTELEEIHIFRDLPQHQKAADTLGETALEQIRERFAETQSWDAYPHTEPSAEFRARVTEAMESVVLAHPTENIVVACHAGVINAYLATILDLEPDMFFRPVHASVHRVRFGIGRRVVEVLNEQHYLASSGLVSV